MKYFIHRIPNWIEKCTLWVGSILAAAVVLMLISSGGTYSGILFNNRLLMVPVIGLGVMGGVCYIFACGKKHKPAKHDTLRLLLSYGILFCLQLWWANQVYFEMGWDVGLMKYWAEFVAKGGSLQECSANIGYSIYPNNLLLFYVTYLILKLGILFSMETPYYLCVYSACLSVNLACFLGHMILRRLTKNTTILVIYAVIAFVFIIGSPWSMVPYSDAYGMLFVMFGLWSLICCDRKYLKWVLVAFAAIIGYHIKPTALFPLFAITLSYGVRYLIEWRKKGRELAVLGLSCLFFWTGGLFIPLWVQHTFSFQLYPEMRMPFQHYLMMGANETSNGEYNHDDFLFSNKFPDLESRKKANMEVYWQRLEAMLTQGRLGDFVAQKALFNFNSGDFYWYGNGAPYMTALGQDTIWNQLFLEFADDDGKYYGVFLTVMQCIWLWQLWGLLFLGCGWQEHRPQKACMLITLCGLGIFLMLFEARARYLYLYSPVILILSLCGYEGLYRKLRIRCLHYCKRNERRTHT